MLLADTTGMGKTGEPFIVNEKTLALSEVKFREDAPLKLQLTTTRSRYCVMS
ncbi:MAG TPA: hypothetical protein QGH10_27355 [Armatimonadota bacterium]|nr:hypothetical protein [Armatimonadota bacterium]